MEQIKNKMIAAIVAAIIIAINDPATPVGTVTSLTEQVTSLYALDKELTAQAEIPAADPDASLLEVIKDLKAQLKEALIIKAGASESPVGESSDGVKYTIKSGAHGIGSAAEIAADPLKIDKLLKINGQTVAVQLT